MTFENVKMKISHFFVIKKNNYSSIKKERNENHSESKPDGDAPMEIIKHTTLKNNDRQVTK